MIERWMIRSERWMYASGRPNRTAAVLNGWWARAGRLGIWRSRLVTLEVTGRTSGRTLACPLIVVRHGRERYLVSMLGERASWVRNVRAAGGAAVLRHGGREPVILEEIQVAERAAVIRRHLDVAPAARSFVPVKRKADLAEFDRIAGAIPVFRVRALAATPASDGVSGPADPARAGDVADGMAPPPRRRRRSRRRWLVAIGIGLIAVLAVTYASIGAYVSGSAEPPLSLARSVAPPAGPLAATWSAASGSTAGFRIEQTVLGFTGDVVGRTGAVSGTATLTASEVTAGSFTVDLTAIKANGRRSPQLDQTVETSKYPDATVRLVNPIALTPAFASGETLRATASATFTLHGVTRPVSVAIAARRDGASIYVAGSVPVTFADYGMRTPAGFGWLGSVGDGGQAEFLLLLRH